MRMGKSKTIDSVWSCSTVVRPSLLCGSLRSLPSLHHQYSLFTFGKKRACTCRVLQRKHLADFLGPRGAGSCVLTGTSAWTPRQERQHAVPAPGVLEGSWDTSDLQQRSRELHISETVMKSQRKSHLWSGLALGCAFWGMRHCGVDVGGLNVFHYYRGPIPLGVQS